MSKEVVVIGGGPAGIEAAREAAKLGLAVTMVSAEPVGGRAGWHSLLPSKVWLAAAETAHTAGAKADPRAILEQVAAVKQSWNGQERASLDALGVKVVLGTAVFATTGELAVLNAEGERIDSFKDIPVIVSSGSVPVFPPGLKPDVFWLINGSLANLVTNTVDSLDHFLLEMVIDLFAQVANVHINRVGQRISAVTPDMFN